MKTTTTPAPRRAGNTSSGTVVRRTRGELRAMLKRLEHDPESLELVARLVEKLASRSPGSRR